MADFVHLTVAANGRVVIPADFRSRLGLVGGGQVIARMVDNSVVLEPVSAAIRRAQVAVSRYVPQGTALSEELIADRRKAALDE